jgi:hypothetical protein
VLPLPERSAHIAEEFIDNFRKGIAKTPAPSEEMKSNSLVCTVTVDELRRMNIAVNVAGVDE